MTADRETFGQFAERTRERFEEFAGRLASRGAGPRPAPALEEDYWRGLRDLFTRDVTPDGLRDLLQHETRETFRFFTRDVDLRDLQDRPWPERWGIALWRTFQAMAYRLSPWRRILFAVAVPILFVGWLRVLFIVVAAGPLSLAPLSSWESWAVGGASAVFLLLVLELRDKLGLKSDLEVARQIQFGLLPFEPFAQDGVRIATAMRPANTVGGDYFDVIDLGPGRIAVVVADVAGKGMPAALLMALLQGSLRTLVSAGMRGAELVTTLNAHLTASLPSNRLITFFYAEVETATGGSTWVNAGHNPPFLLPASGPARRLEPNGIALGVLADAVFVAEPLQIEPGDRLFVYTDGLTEAASPADEEFGDARLLTALEARRGATGETLIAEVIAEALRFCGPARPRDDMTLLALGRDA